MNAEPPLVVLLHALGSSSREWRAVEQVLSPSFNCLSLDLPGFGGRGTETGVSVAEMADWLAAEIRRRTPAAYILVGHSMSAKLCSVLARRSEDGEEGLSGLEGVILVSGSPPEPEPMQDDARNEMIGWVIKGPVGEQDAKAFVDNNVAEPLSAENQTQAIGDVRRSDPFAWKAWLERGSREDWSSFVGRLAVPAVLMAGGEDDDLGPDAQRRLNLPHYPQGRVVVMQGVAHLLPYERPNAIADQVRKLWEEVAPSVLNPDYAHLLTSQRVSRRTRRALLNRSRNLHPDLPGCLGEDRLKTLEAVLAVVLPHGRADLNLAHRIDVALAKGEGDGWRFAELPPDKEAWAQGLDTLNDLTGGFAGLSPDKAHDAARKLAAGEMGVAGEGRLDRSQMRLWFEDLRAEAVRTWLGLPSSLARIGYDGFANGGDRQRLQGFTSTHANEPEPWEPDAARFKMIGS